MAVHEATTTFDLEPEPPDPAADLRALDRLVGTWTVTDPSDEGFISGEVRYRWLEGGHFLVQDVDLLAGGHPQQGLEVIGHEQLFGAEPGTELKSRFYGRRGETFDYVYQFDGATLTIWGGAVGSPAYYRGDFNDDGSVLSGAWVWPGGGYQAVMTRVDDRG